MVPFSPLFPGVSPQLFQPQPLSGQTSQNQQLNLGKARGCEAGMTAFMPILALAQASVFMACACVSQVCAEDQMRLSACEALRGGPGTEVSSFSSPGVPKHLVSAVGLAPPAGTFPTCPGILWRAGNSPRDTGELGQEGPERPFRSEREPEMGSGFLKVTQWLGCSHSGHWSL